MLLVLYISKDKSYNEIKKSLNSFSIKIICLILILVIIFLIYFKNNEMLFYKNISLEDFELLKKILFENYLGRKEELNKCIIKNKFILDCSNKRKLSEEKYIKFVLPILYKLIEKFNYDNRNKINDCKFIIDESDVIISGQKVKLWSFSQQ
jgi:mannose/fructose/N-acetylgalactosamine-specific phosphotransferase system component IID